MKNQTSRLRIGENALPCLRRKLPQGLLLGKGGECRQRDSALAGAEAPDKSVSKVRARLMKVTVSVAQVPHPSEQLSPQNPGPHPHWAIDSEKLKDEK